MDVQYAGVYDRFEQRHWWFVARRKILCEMIDVRIDPRPGARWLDVGCGGGGLLAGYRRIRDKMGVDVEPGLLDAARARGLDVRLLERETGLSEVADRGPFDLISACDVLEHVDDDAALLGQISRLLKPGGSVLLTVPALRSLWSAHDVTNHHRRRYRRPELIRLAEGAGFGRIYCSYFCSFLLPLVYAGRKGKQIAARLGIARTIGVEPDHDLHFGPAKLDAAMEKAFASERHVLREGTLPVGSSLVLVAKKPMIADS